MLSISLLFLGSIKLVVIPFVAIPGVLSIWYALGGLHRAERSEAAKTALDAPESYDFCFTMLLFWARLADSAASIWVYRI